MSVELEPSELGFRRPFTHEVSQVLHLSNPNSDPVAFKVKTTAPKQYCVRPNSGRIEPKKDVEVQVLLQAMKEDPPLDARCRDKFLVQSILIDGGQEDVTSIWSNIDKLAKDSVKEKKIRVTFLPAATAPTRSDENTPIPDEAPPAYDSPSPTTGISPSAATAPSTAREYETPTKSPLASAPAPSGSDDRASQSQSSSTPLASTVTSTLNTAASSVSAAASSTNAALQAQLESAQATIKNLRAQVEEQGLRQRKSEAVAQDARERVSTGTTGLGVQSQPAEGVPVQVVAALCLLSFLLAYFFF